MLNNFSSEKEQIIMKKTDDKIMFYVIGTKNNFIK